MPDSERRKRTAKRKTAAPRGRIAPRAKPKAKDDAATKARKQAKRSHLEVRWMREWARQGGPELVEEFQFHPTRRWRADFAHLPTRTLIEIEGGAWGGRHTKGAGFKADLDKYLTAHLYGWTVVRIGAHQVRGDIVAAVIGRIALADSAESPGDSAESRQGFKSVNPTGNSAESSGADGPRAAAGGCECGFISCRWCRGGTEAEPGRRRCAGCGQPWPWEGALCGACCLSAEAEGAGAEAECGEGCGCAAGDCLRDVPGWLRGAAA